jgi:hypothetical protein
MAPPSRSAEFRDECTNAEHSDIVWLGLKSTKLWAPPKPKSLTRNTQDVTLMAVKREYVEKSSKSLLTIQDSALRPVATKSRFSWSQREIIQKRIMTQIAGKTAISMRVSSKLQPPIARSTTTDPLRHCVGGHEETQCTREDREYNVPLRVGLLFVILVTSAIGVFLPILLTSFTRLTQTSIVFVILKQFGTGIVISTAFVHVRRLIFA